MQSGCSLNHLAHLTLLQRKRCLFELLLHIPAAEEAPVSCQRSDSTKTRSLSRHLQIAALPCTAAVRLGRRQLRKRLGFSTIALCSALICLDLRLVAFDELARLLLGPGDLGFSPTGRTSAVLVLDKKMGCPDLVATVCVVGRRYTLGAMVGSHVLLELLGVGACWRLPSRVLCRGVKVVREILAVGATNLPALGQSCFAGRLRSVSVA